MSIPSSNLSKLATLFFSDTLGLPSLNLELNQDWSSNTENHRFALRKRLQSWVANKKVPLDVLKSLGVPGLLVHCPNFSWSIAHSRTMGGVLLYECSSKKIVSLGLDVEELGRITPKIIDRIATKSECSLFHSSEFIWPLKEAGFKAFSNHYRAKISQKSRLKNTLNLETLKINSITQIKINSVRKLSNYSYLCALSFGKKKGKGAILLKNNLFIATIAVSI